MSTSKYGCACASLSKFGGSRRASYRAAVAKITADGEPKKKGIKQKKKPKTLQTPQTPHAPQSSKKAKTKMAVPKKKKAEYFLRPGKVPEDVKKYCRCLAGVGARQDRRYNPYAVCGRLRPAGMKGGCSVLYDYHNMPKDILQGQVSMHNKRNARELIESAMREAKRLKR